MYKKLLCVLLVAVMACSPFVMPVFSADSTTDKYKQQINALQEKERQYQEQLNKTKSNIADKVAYSKTLVSQIGVLTDEITSSHKQLDELNKNISEKKKKIKEANNKIETQMNALKRRVRTIYMAGGTSDLEIILGAKDFSDFLDKFELVRTLSDYDKQLINKVKAQLSVITEEKKALEEEKQEVEKTENTLKSKQSKLSNLLSENESVLSALYNDKDNAQAMLNNASSQESEIQKQLDSYYKKQEAARKAAQIVTPTPTAPANTRKNRSSSYSGGGSGAGPYSGSGGSGSSSSVNVAPSGYTWPVPGFYYVISPFNENRGYSHKGIDIAGGGIMGATVVAAAGGKVIASNNSCTHNFGKSGSCGCGGGYGNYVLIAHPGGKTTLYGHLSSASVSTGMNVSKGQTVGFVGSTGWSTGAHLHYECRLNGSPYNPMNEY
ncbi:MAG: peptidoglycan DD-metalloendopeptidase family protein [Ruminococcus sp.]|nr:peptidoglycan DD-metalloendopeptidase family protein [Ruminococcus sp.]